MRNIDQDTITQAVLDTLDGCRDPRLRAVMASLVRHLHSFAREVRLTGAEWARAIGFLTATGHVTDDRRQEFILLSDVLGLSTLVTAQNNVRPAGCSESTVFGPFFVEDAPHFDNGADMANGAAGLPCFVAGSVRGLGGEPVAQAVIDVWQADENGFYDVQLPAQAPPHEHRARGRLRSRDDGGYHFRSIMAEPYPIPHDGPVGQLLEALGRHPWRPAHLHFMTAAPGYDTPVTHVFREGSDDLDSDAVSGVRSTLVADWVRHDPGLAPDGTWIDGEFYTLHHDFVLNPAGAAG